MIKCLKNTKNLLARLYEIFGIKAFGFVLFLLISGLLCMIFFPQTTNWIEYPFYDARHSYAARFRAPDPSLVIVAIDMQSLEYIDKRWPWPREEIAEIIRLIGNYEPRGQIIDILFQNPDTKYGDKALAKEISRQGNVILISALEEQQTRRGRSLAKFGSYQKLVDSALDEGFVWGVIDSDGVVRSFKMHEERLNADSAVYKALKHFYGYTDKQMSGLPVQTPVIFSREHGGIAKISLKQILKEEPDLDIYLRDSVVLVGATAPILHDFHNSPVGILPGVEILAHSLDSHLKPRIGKIVINEKKWRAIMMLSGAIVAWYCIMAFNSTIITVLVGLALAFCLSVVSELLLFFPPILMFGKSWVITFITFFLLRYFDSVFALRKLQIEAQNAHEVQCNLLPDKKLIINNYSVFGVSRSASELCGDYFDYFVVDDRYLFVIIGDVTGHGVASALAMAIGKASVLLSIKQYFKPAQIIETMNSTLLESMQKRLLMTAAIIWIDTHTNEFEYRNCGHPYPYYTTKDGDIKQLESFGIPLGARKVFRAGKPHVGIMNCGDRIILYSDALVESMPEAIEKDGFILFQNYISQRPTLPVDEACYDMIDSHPHFNGDQAQPDDFTVVIVERA